MSGGRRDLRCVVSSLVCLAVIAACNGLVESDESQRARAAESAARPNGPSADSTETPAKGTGSKTSTPGNDPKTTPPKSEKTEDEPPAGPVIAKPAECGAFLALGDVAKTPPWGKTPFGGPVLPRIDQAMKDRWRAVLASGLSRGNSFRRFSKIGDSITANAFYMTPLGATSNVGLNLGNFGSLGGMVNFFRQEKVDDRGFNSFDHPSLSAWPGWLSSSVFDPQYNQETFYQKAGTSYCFAPYEPQAACEMRRRKPVLCQADESSLGCELRITKPAFALIMLGTNDVYWVANVDDTMAQLRRIVKETEAAGVVPVLSTIPDYFAFNAQYLEKSHLMTHKILLLALELGVPAMDYWSSLQYLPNKGLAGTVATLQGDLVHPGAHPAGAGVFTAEGLAFGYNMRNIVSLMTLTKLTQVLTCDGPPDP